MRDKKERGKKKNRGVLGRLGLSVTTSSLVVFYSAAGGAPKAQKSYGHDLTEDQQTKLKTHVKRKSDPAVTLDFEVPSQSFQCRFTSIHLGSEWSCKSLITFLYLSFISFRKTGLQITCMNKLRHRDWRSYVAATAHTHTCTQGQTGTHIWKWSLHIDVSLESIFTVTWALGFVKNKRCTASIGTQCSRLASMILKLKGEKWDDMKWKWPMINL